jgi:hypothetical protein
LTLSVQSIWGNGVHRDEILYHHLGPTEGELFIFLFIASASVTAHGYPISRIVIDEQNGNLVDLLLTSVVEAFSSHLKGDRFNTQCTNLPQTLPRRIA